MRESSVRHIKYILSVYGFGLLFFTLFRFILFLTQTQQLENIPQGEALTTILQAFWMGFRFDTVISGYLLALPFLLLCFFDSFNLKQKWPYLLVHYFILITYSLAFLICAGDIPYFNQFFNRTNIASFQWNESPDFVFKMIFQEFRYWWILIPLIFVVFIFGNRITKILHRIYYSRNKAVGRRLNNFAIVLKRIALSILFAGLIFVAIRGRVAGKSPIRVGTAYFSNYAFPNQLGLNPVFTLMKSYLNSKKDENKGVKLMDDQLAIQNVQNFLNIDDAKEFNSPLARTISPDSSLSQKRNVVLVLMESMSACKIGIFGNPDSLTPNLDSLANHGYCFNEIYTSGIHTFNGVYSTLFAYPSLFRQHPLKGVNIPKYDGMASSLKQLGYNTAYFTTHDDQFDNIGGFLKANDFDQVISQKDYPSDKVLSTLGVPDDYLFEFAMPVLNKMSQQGPFLSVFMTASDHGPYTLPEYYQASDKDIKKQIVEYADWSIGRFMKEARKQTWFDNTLFVFVADHGAAINTVYDMPINYHHTPLIFYNPNIINEPESFDNFGGQIDVFPTIMGMLKLPYINNSFGIDLLEEQRPCMYFTADDKYGVIDQEFFLVVRNNKVESLYKYKTKDTRNYISEFGSHADRLKNYAASNFQMAQWMIRNNKVKNRRNDI